MTVTTRTENEETGTELTFDSDGNLTSQRSVAREVGTTVTLKVILFIYFYLFTFEIYQKRRKNILTFFVWVYVEIILLFTCSITRISAHSQKRVSQTTGNNFSCLYFFAILPTSPETID